MWHQKFRQMLKIGFSFFCILILLPYIVTIFFQGKDGSVLGERGNSYIKYQADGESKEVLWTDYMMGVLAQELPGKMEPEALKAQTILLRTALCREWEESEDGVFTTPYWMEKKLKEKWGIYTQEWKWRLEKAIRETKGQVLIYQGTYARTPFHQSSSGQTRDGAELFGTEGAPYLVSRECPLDKEATQEMHLYEMSYAEVRKKCQTILEAVLKEEAERKLQYEDFIIEEKEESGYVRRVKICGTSMSGEQFRNFLGLAASAFEFQKGEEDRLKIVTMGNGHGLGLSQWTAQEMAKEGKSCEEILNYFFEGTKIEEKEEICDLPQKKE